MLNVAETKTENKAVKTISGSHSSRPATTVPVMLRPTVDPMIICPQRRVMSGAGRCMPAMPIAAAATSGPSTQASGRWISEAPYPHSPAAA